jgi:hypothetical protein
MNQPDSRRDFMKKAAFGNCRSEFFALVFVVKKLQKPFQTHHADIFCHGIVFLFGQDWSGQLEQTG